VGAMSRGGNGKEARDKALRLLSNKVEHIL
jgi:hypothetical protein